MERVVQSGHRPDPVQWCVKQLEAADDYFLSTHDLWQKYCTEFSCDNLSYNEFENTLCSDKILRVSSGIREDLPTAQRNILTDMGYPLKALVALSERKPPPEALDSAISAKAIQLRNALEKAWNARPPGDEDIEERLRLIREKVEVLLKMMGNHLNDSEQE